MANFPRVESATALRSPRCAQLRVRTLPPPRTRRRMMSNITEPRTATPKLRQFHPVTPACPNKPMMNPPKRAPTMPTIISKMMPPPPPIRKPAARPARPPKTIQDRIPMIYPVETRSGCVTSVYTRCSAFLSLNEPPGANPGGRGSLRAHCLHYCRRGKKGDGGICRQNLSAETGGHESCGCKLGSTILVLLRG